MKKVISFINRYPLVVLFAAALLALTVLDMIFSDRHFSEVENRELAQRPALTWEGLLDLSFGREYDEYLSDQFFARDRWIGVKSRVDGLMGKTENNGILYGKEGFLFEKLFAADTDKLSRNIGYLDAFADSCPHPLCVMMIPNAYQVYPELLPAGAQPVDQLPVFGEIADRLGERAVSVELMPSFEAHEGYDLFYRTDHHWTTEGAYLAYQTLCGSLGLTPCDRATLPMEVVDGFYGTHYSKCKAQHVQPDTITYYDIPDVKMTIRTVDETGGFVYTDYDSLYDKSKFDAYDKYAAFLYSNNDLTVITNTAPDAEARGKRLCVIKDSYANSLLPFLTQNYEEISVIDIRFFNESLKAYLTANPFDQVLVMYNFSTFNTENIVRISM